MTKLGRFIVIDGGKGAGKGSVIKKIKESCSDPKILFTREPGGSEFGESIRELLFSEEGKKADAFTQFCLFCAARRDHSSRKIEPALKSGVHVISDRLDSSTWGYQIVAERNGLLTDLFWAMRYFCLSTCPDIYIFLDVDPTEGLRRMNQRNEGTHFDDKDVEFHTRARKGFLEFMEIMKHKGVQTKIVDANRPLDVVTNEVLAIVRSIIA